MNRTLVSLAKTNDYGPSLRPIVEALLAPLGGMGAFVKPGQNVLIKPNLLTSRAPEQAVTTHPELVRVIIRLAREHGGKVSVADSPSNVTKLEDVWARSGFKAMCDEEDVPLLNLEKAGSVPFTVGPYTFSLAKPVLDADVLINVPKVKTHTLTTFTCGVKNMYGAVPGFQKAQLHKNWPTVSQFSGLLAAIYSKARPHLSIADGILAMDGDGPSAGRPFKLGMLAASADAVAMDVVICQILGISPDSVRYFSLLSRDLLGNTDPSNIEIVGEKPAALKPAGYAVPSTAHARLIPGWLVKMLGGLVWIRPEFTNTCVSCGLCVKSCPMDAISMEPNARPRLEPSLCIGCCCCHEICPEKAIRMKQSPLLNLVRHGKLP